jgi:hypothetical protein
MLAQRSLSQNSWVTICVPTVREGKVAKIHIGVDETAGNTLPFLLRRRWIGRRRGETIHALIETD